MTERSPWPTVRLGEAAAYRKDPVTIDDLATYKRPRVQLHAQGVILRDEILGAAIKTKKQQVCHTGDFLVAEIDAKVGGFGIVPESLDGSIVSSHYFLYAIDETKLQRSFLDCFIRTPAFREQVEAQGSTNYAAIRPSDVLGYEIPLPPLAVQRRIVARIEELAARIAEARALRRAAAREAETLSTRAAFRVLERAEALFPIHALEDCVILRGGGTPSKANLLYWSGTIPWVTPKDMKVREIHDSIDHISDQAVVESPAKLIDPGAVLVVVRGMILAHTFPSAVLRVRAAINQDMKALIPKSHVLPEYLCSVFWALQSRVLALVEKSSHDTRKLETPVLLSTGIPVPPLPDQRRIVSELDALHAKVEKLEHVQAETAAELDALLPSILDRTFKGEL